MLVITELLSPSESNTAVSLPASAGNFERLMDRFSDVLGYVPKESLFFDIETTGLSAANSMVFLIGAIYFDGQNWLLKQLLAQNEADECCILKEFFRLAQNYHTLIHFNGTTFDIPYTKERAIHHGLSHSLETMHSIDLYQRFRPLKNLLGLPRMNQLTLEQFLKWPRQDQLTGRHMISLFKKYSASGEKRISDLLLLHNHDDLFGMTQLLRFGAYLLFLNGDIESVSANTLKCPPESLHMEGCHCTQEEMRTSLSTAFKNNESAIFELNFQLREALPSPLSVIEDKTSRILYINGKNGKLLLPLYHGELKYFFPDYRNYYYLPLEDQAIHKSVGAYVDTNHRENAKPATCYVRKTADFLPQPKVLFQPSFREAYNSRDFYFEYKKEYLNSPEQLLSYARLLLSDFITFS